MKGEGSGSQPGCSNKRGNKERSSRVETRAGAGQGEERKEEEQREGTMRRVLIRQSSATAGTNNTTTVKQ